MIDLIDRAEAVGALKRAENITKAFGYHNVIETIKELPSAQRWIPVSECLPEEDTDVLVTVYFKGLKIEHKTGWNDHIKPKYYVDIASRIGDTWVSNSDDYKVAKDRHEVVAWMPLMEPWKNEETG